MLLINSISRWISAGTQLVDLLKDSLQLLDERVAVGQETSRGEHPKGTVSMHISDVGKDSRILLRGFGFRPAMFIQLADRIAAIRWTWWLCRYL